MHNIQVLLFGTFKDNPNRIGASFIFIRSSYQKLQGNQNIHYYSYIVHSVPCNVLEFAKNSVKQKSILNFYLLITPVKNKI